MTDELSKQRVIINVGRNPYTQCVCSFVKGLPTGNKECTGTLKTEPPWTVCEEKDGNLKKQE